MEEQDNLYPMKRNYSKSPIYQNNIRNDEDIMNNIRQSQSSQNLDSILSTNNYPQEEVFSPNNRNKEYKQLLNQKDNIINKLLLKSKKDEKRSIRMKNAYDTLKEQIIL